MNCDKHHWISPYSKCPKCESESDLMTEDIIDTILDVAITENSFSSAADSSSANPQTTWDGGGGDFSGGGASEEF